MDLYLQRTHFKTGTIGVLFHRGQFLCFCIELPWLQNQRSISCIPDGTYELKRFYSVRFKHHFIVKNVPNRSGILIHPANIALEELKGCIAPVSQLTGMAKGLGSRKALDSLMLRVEAYKEAGEALFLNISSEHAGR